MNLYHGNRKYRLGIVCRSKIMSDNDPGVKFITLIIKYYSLDIGWLEQHSYIYFFLSDYGTLISDLKFDYDEDTDGYNALIYEIKK